MVSRDGVQAEAHASRSTAGNSEMEICTTAVNLLAPPACHGQGRGGGTVEEPIADLSCLGPDLDLGSENWRPSE